MGEISPSQNSLELDVKQQSINLINKGISFSVSINKLDCSVSPIKLIDLWIKNTNWILLRLIITT